MAPIPQRPSSPRRNKTVPGSGDAADLAHRQMPSVLSSVPSLPPSKPTQSGGSSRRTKSQSPTRGGKSVNQIRSLDSYTIYDLEECEPKVLMREYDWVEKNMKEVPQEVMSLFKRLERISTKVFPSELKAAFKEDASDPSKPKPSPKANEFLSPSSSLFPPQRLDHLKEVLDHTVYKSKQDYRKAAHERDWAAVGAGVLLEFELWSSQHIRLLNIETVAIEVTDFRIRTQHGQILQWDEEINAPTSTASNQEGCTISRMVDWAMALDLSEREERIVQRGNTTLPSYLRSVNQTSSWIRSFPIFLDIEMKKTHSDRDPKVQLAVWACGAMLKRRWHGWDTRMPMPGITVTGPIWEYFIFFELNGELIMIGPYNMGSTKELHGMWKVANCLQILIEWGKNEYRQWWEKTVLKYFERLPEQMM
ncbi:MAG: hypothetical protein Q9179_006050 [Wetmoreana sp. 5 TL-2023]